MQTKVIAPLRYVLLQRARYKAGPLMAQAAYESLTEEEEETFKRIARGYPVLIQERADYAALADNVKLAAEELPFDLLPRIESYLDEDAAPARFPRRAQAVVAMAAALLLLAGIYVGVMTFSDSSTMPGIARPVVALPADASPRTPLAQAIDRACQNVISGDAAAAVEEIKSLISAHSDDPYVGEAQLILAEAKYVYLQNYQDAYAAYNRLREAYPEVFASSPDSILRYELLSEAQCESFAPLYELDNARKHPENAFKTYERLIAQYPGTTLAAAAMEEMCSLVGEPRLASAEALKHVRERCSDPVVIAQVDLALGDVFAQIHKDKDLAKAHYMRAATSGHVVLTHRAREALTRID